MPIIDGVIDIPALAWCTAFEAIMWMMRRRVPIDPQFDGIGDLAIFLDDDGTDIRDSRKYLEYCNNFFHLCEAGAVNIKGKPSRGTMRFRLERHDVIVECPKWGDFEDIPISKIKKSGRIPFSQIGFSGFLTDGGIYLGETIPSTAWAYSNILVNFDQIMHWFPPHKGQAVRIGNEVRLIEPRPQQGKSDSPEAPGNHLSINGNLVTVVLDNDGAPYQNPPPGTSHAKTRNVGGRPRKWDWDGAITATCLAIYGGNLQEDDRASWTKFMADWLTANNPSGDAPDESEIRKRIRKIEEQVQDQAKSPENAKTTAKKK